MIEKAKKILIIGLSALITITCAMSELSMTVLAQENISDEENLATTNQSGTTETTQNIPNKNSMSEKAVLGTIAELFPNEEIAKDVAWDVGNVSLGAQVTQEQLDKVRELRSNGKVHYSNDDLKNLHLLRNLKVIDWSVEWSVESTSFLWKEIAALKELEILSLVQPSNEQGKNALLTIEVPYLPKLKELTLHMWGSAPTGKPFQYSSTHVYDGSSLNKNNLPALEILKLDTTPLKQYDTIGTLTTLQELDVNFSQIKDIEFIRSLTSLTELNIAQNQISNFTPLQGLTKLNKVFAYDQRNYYCQQNAIELYVARGNELKLPARITNINGDVLTGANFSNYDIANPQYDEGTQEIYYNDVIYDDLKQYSFWLGDFDFINNVAKPYTVEKGSKVNWSADLPNNLGKISGFFLYEIKKVDELKPSAPNTRPTIDAENRALKVGDVFDPLEGVTAFDEKDGILLLNESNVIANNVDTAVVGSYEVTYEVTNSRGLSSSKTIIVSVEKVFKPTVSNKRPRINAENRILKVGDVFDPLKGVTAFDEKDGIILLDESNVIANNVDTNVIGSYEVTYKVMNSRGFSSSKTIIVTVEENILSEQPKQDNDVTTDLGNKDEVITSMPNETPQTGDSSNFGLLAIMMLSSVSLLLILRKNKFSKRR